MATLLLPFILFTLSIISVVSNANVPTANITEVLSAYQNYSQFNSLLTLTKLSDEINTRPPPITVLVVHNDVVAKLPPNPPLLLVKILLSIHTLLDYFDYDKLQHISPGDSLSSTNFFQTTGLSQDDIGHLNIAKLKDNGKIIFGSANSNLSLGSIYIKSVKQIPYNLSLLEVSTPIISPDKLPAPTLASKVDIKALLEKASCYTFAKLSATTGVLKMYQTAISKAALTVFAPTDDAFKATGLPDLTKLTNAEVISLLQYHALWIYAPKGTLKVSKDSISTLATKGAGNYYLTFGDAGDSITIHAGINRAVIASTLIDTAPLVIYTVDNVLLPKELFPAPAPAPAPGPGPVTPSQAPSASPYLPPPAPVFEPPSEAPAPSPSQNSTSKSSASTVKASISVTHVVIVSVLTVLSA